MEGWRQKLALARWSKRALARASEMMPTGTALTPERAALVFAFLVAVIGCALPLTGTFGPESSILFALTLSPWAAALGAHAAVSAQTTGAGTGTLLARSIAMSWRLLLVPVALLALNGLRVDPCDPMGGLRFLALGPWLSVTLAAVVGVALGSAFGSARVAVTLAVLAPLLELARAVHGFLRTPAIFAFGHFFGYFPGTFYDRRVEVPEAWLSHRLLGALIGGGLWALLSAARDPVRGRIVLARVIEHPVLVALSGACALASAWIGYRAESLHHATSSAALREQLGLVVETAHCRAVLPRETSPGDAQRLAEDCEFRIAQIERLLGVRERERITAFFFRSAQEKRIAMGAARVYIAKPWRREVYLQLAEYPHLVLPHELAHVVARHAARGPFGVPGRLFGLVPEPTLVEGMAVALEPHARDELTAHQWAKAAQAAKVAPPLERLLGAGFFGANQALAYTLAGSFLRFVLEQYGSAALRQVYAQGSVEAALHKPLRALEQAWRAYLERVPLPARAAALARLRFERPGVLSQVCPHLVERLEGELGAALGAGDLERALESCRAVLAVDSKDTGSRATLVGLLARMGQDRAAAAELTRLKGPPAAPTPVLARAKSALADASFQRGRHREAEASYRALLAEPQPENELRQIEVKLLALEAGEPARSLLRELLLSDTPRGNDGRVAVHLIRELAAVRSDGLAPYLEARQLLGADRHDLALSLLRAALAHGLPTERLRVEALRMHALASFVTGSLGEAEAVAAELERREGATLAEQQEAKDWRERITFRRTELAR